MPSRPTTSMSGSLKPPVACTAAKDMQVCSPLPATPATASIPGTVLSCKAVHECGRRVSPNSRPVADCTQRTAMPPAHPSRSLPALPPLSLMYPYIFPCTPCPGRTRACIVCVRLLLLDSRGHRLQEARQLQLLGLVRVPHSKEVDAGAPRVPNLETASSSSSSSVMYKVAGGS